MTLNKISKAFFINLDRRTDRLEHINKNLPFSAERFTAIDAKNLDLNDEIEKIFGKNLEKFTKAEIACALSHYKLWKQLTQDKTSRNYLILEDDVVFKPGFTVFWNEVFSEEMPPDYNLIYLGGCQPWNKPHYHKVLKRHNLFFFNIKKNDFFTKEDHFWHMNASSYILSKQAASLLCQWVEQKGIDQALDNFMQNFFNKNKIFSSPDSIYHLNPLMSYQLHEENDNTEIDKNSDLRCAKEKFELDKDKKLSNNKSLTELLIPLKTNLTKKRIGAKGDGGYVLLQEIFNDSDTVYSYGIDDSENSDSFDTECANHNKTVFMFDGTIEREQSKNPRLIFKKENLTADNLRSHLLINNNINKKNMILKMDIEGHEYPVIEKNIKLINDCFSMMCIEFHGLNNPNYYNYENKNDILELILEYYDIFHMHANNWVERKFEVPSVMEISFIRKGACSSELDCAYPIKGLDFPNCANRNDYSLDWWVKEEIEFPFLRELKSKKITNKIHISWKDENVITSNQPLIQKGIANLLKLNPGWEMEIYNDEDIDKMLRNSISLEDWNLIKNKKITEKTDLWRLLKTYQEGGLYIDIDRYIDTPLSEIINPKSKIVLPTFQDIDFSQDFILTCPKNPLIGRAIANNLKYRREGKNLFFLAVYSYMHSVSQMLSGKTVERGKNEEYFQNIRRKIDNCQHMETYRESGPGNHILFRNKNSDFSMQQFEKDKADFYNHYNVTHWNDDTRKKHESINLQTKNTNFSLSEKAKEFISLKNQWQNFKDYNFFNYIAHEIPELKPPENKFDTYNANQKIAIVSLYTKEIADYATHSENSIKEYCEKQGYTFYIYREKLEKKSNPNWSKAQALLNHIDDHEYIIWMDSDTLIFNPNKKLEEIISKSPKKFILATKDIGGNSMLNSGVLFFKSHTYTKNLIKRWRDFNGDKSSLYSSGGDQEVLCEILKKSDEAGFNRKIFEMNEFNTDPRLVNSETFILHFMAYPHQLKKILMSYWNNS